MDKENLLKYGPLAIVVISILLQWNMFARPADVEILHRVILTEVAERYVAKEQYNDVKTQMRDIQLKIDKIYDKIMGNK